MEARGLVPLRGFFPYLSDLSFKGVSLNFQIFRLPIREEGRGHTYPFSVRTKICLQVENRFLFSAGKQIFYLLRTLSPTFLYLLGFKNQIVTNWTCWRRNEKMAYQVFVYVNRNLISIHANRNLLYNFFLIWDQISKPMITRPSQL